MLKDRQMPKERDWSQQHVISLLDSTDVRDAITRVGYGRRGLATSSPYFRVSRTTTQGGGREEEWRAPCTECHPSSRVVTSPCFVTWFYESNFGGQS